MTVMDITIHQTYLPPEDPGAFRDPAGNLVRIQELRRAVQRSTGLDRTDTHHSPRRDRDG
jgi:hypothetical protein